MGTAAGKALTGLKVDTVILVANPGNGNDIKAAISSASAGDTVVIPAGEFRFREEAIALSRKDYEETQKEAKQNLDEIMEVYYGRWTDFSM